jgi:hypothetical protein
MAKETDGRSRATMNEADLEYLRNINPNKWVSREDMERAQSDAKPALPQTLRDAAENLLIAIGMGWDLNGCAENLRAALAQPDAEPTRDVFMEVLASLVAVVSLLKRGGKKAAPSDKMFDQMILDYERAIERGRAALAQSDAEPRPGSANYIPIGGAGNGA